MCDTFHGITTKDTIRQNLRLLGKSGKKSERAIAAARRAAEWLSAGGFCSYSNEDFDIDQSLVSAITCDWVL